MDPIRNRRGLCCSFPGIHTWLRSSVHRFYLPLSVRGELETSDALLIFLGTFPFPRLLELLDAPLSLLFLIQKCVSDANPDLRAAGVGYASAIPCTPGLPSSR